KPPKEFKHIKSNFQSYQLRLLPDAPISRDDLLKSLIHSGIHAQGGIRPIHLEKIYKDYSRSLPETEKAAREIIMLPIYHQLRDEEQEFIIERTLELVGE